MKTRMITVAVALGCITLTHAQEGTSRSAVVGPGPIEQGQGDTLKSAYHDCLLNAGKETYTVLGLNEGQVVRISELQGRYKADLKMADEARAPQAKKMKKGVKAEPATKQPAAQVATLPPAEKSTAVDQTGVAGEDAMEQLRVAEQGAAMSTDVPAEQPLLAPETTIQTPVLDIPSDPATGDELQGILTALQFNMWHKQCYNGSSETGMMTE